MKLQILKFGEKFHPSSKHNFGHHTDHHHRKYGKIFMMVSVAGYHTWGEKRRLHVF